MKKILSYLFMIALLVIFVAACSSRNEVTSAAAEPTYLTDFNLRADPGNGQVTLNWLLYGGAETYNIYVGTSRSSLSRIATVPAPITSAPYTVTGLTNDTTYYFSISAVQTVDSVVVESSLATPITAMPTSPVPPPAPENVRANAGSANVTVTWTPVADADSYVVTCFWQASATTLGIGSITVEGQASHSQVVGPITWDAGSQESGVSIAGETTPLVNGRLYAFWVRAVSDETGTGYPSFDAWATPSATPPPFAPEDLIATNAASGLHPGEIYLDWTAVAGATSYNVYLGIAKNVTKNSYSVIYVGTDATTGFIATGLDEGRTYYFVVTAIDDNGTPADYSDDLESAESIEVHAIPKASP